ncbi:MAG TPA: hypothetical protein VNN79_08780, partial [Actinomycetota bacterium]|nr:hypothetical protein [Actinomycetota bacterium]
KGSSTGSAAIGGLTENAANFYIGNPLQYASMASLTGAALAYINSGVTSISLVQQGATDSTALTHANFTNTSDFYVTLVYRT